MDIRYLRRYEVVCNDNPYLKETCDVQTQHRTVFPLLTTFPKPPRRLRVFLTVFAVFSPRCIATWLFSICCAPEVCPTSYPNSAGVGPADIQLAEVHDCFAIAEICCTEALGLVDVGHGGKAAREGVTTLGGKIPVNTSGGLKSKGHPVGATGIAQAIEIFEQLRGDAGKRQVDGAKVGLAQNMGGSGASSVVHIFKGV